MTEVEYKSVARLADANGISMADVMRLGVLAFAAMLENDQSACPLVLDSGLFVVAPPAIDDLLPSRNRGGV